MLGGRIEMTTRKDQPLPTSRYLSSSKKSPKPKGGRPNRCECGLCASERKLKSGVQYTKTDTTVTGASSSYGRVAQEEEDMGLFLATGRRQGQGSRLRDSGVEKQKKQQNGQTENFPTTAARTGGGLTSGREASTSSDQRAMREISMNQIETGPPGQRKKTSGLESSGNMSQYSGMEAKKINSSSMSGTGQILYRDLKTKPQQKRTYLSGSFKRLPLSPILPVGDGHGSFYSRDNSSDSDLSPEPLPKKPRVLNGPADVRRNLWSQNPVSPSSASEKQETSSSCPSDFYSESSPDTSMTRSSSSSSSSSSSNDWGREADERIVTKIMREKSSSSYQYSPSKSRFRASLPVAAPSKVYPWEPSDILPDLDTERTPLASFPQNAQLQDRPQIPPAKNKVSQHNDSYGKENEYSDVSSGNQEERSPTPLLPTDNGIPKSKGSTKRLSHYTYSRLRVAFYENRYPSRLEREKLALTLEIPVNRVTQYFQSRRSTVNRLERRRYALLQEEEEDEEEEEEEDDYYTRLGYSSVKDHDESGGGVWRIVLEDIGLESVQAFLATESKRT